MSAPQKQDPAAQIQARYEKVCARIGELYLETEARKVEMTALIKQRDELINAHRKLSEAVTEGSNGTESSQDQAS